VEVKLLAGRIKPVRPLLCVGGPPAGGYHETVAQDHQAVRFNARRALEGVEERLDPFCFYPLRRRGAYWKCHETISLSLFGDGAVVGD
jgi:hypothetical protein